MWTVRPEREEDGPAIESLVIQSFGAGRFAKAAYRLREGVAAVTALSFVATASDDGRLLGSVRFWPVRIGGAASLLLGPLAVEPPLRGKGIGISLMQKGIEEARRLGHTSIVLVGDEPYYGRVGFKCLPAGQIQFPGPVDPNRVLGLSLQPGVAQSLSGSLLRAEIDDPVSAQVVALA